MASGRDTQLTKQIGEYLVAAELSRRGFQCATFSGNIPHYDIAAIARDGAHTPVQVKTIRKGTWQFDATRFVEIQFRGNKQSVGNLVPCPMPGLICVLVRIADYGSDEFYVLPWIDLQALVATSYSGLLLKRGGVRAKTPSTTHTIITPKQIIHFRDNWAIVGRGSPPGA